MVLGTKIDSVNVLYGACDDAEEIYRRDDYSDIADLNPRAAKALLSKELENASAVVAQCDRKGVGILTYDDPLFPSRLKALAAPPTVLYYKGTLRRLDDECVVGMVGTRKHDRLRQKRHICVCKVAGGGQYRHCERSCGGYRRDGAQGRA